MKTPYLQQYREHRWAARQRGIAFRISFDDWLSIWWESGHINERGRRPGQYVMSRIDDCGAYEVGNVAIITSDQNRRERVLSPAAKAKISAAHSGRSKSESHREKIRQAHLGLEASSETRRRLSEAQLVRYASMSSEQRKAQTKAALAARRRNKP